MSFEQPDRPNVHSDSAPILTPVPQVPIAILAAIQSQRPTMSDSSTHILPAPGAKQPNGNSNRSPDDITAREPLAPSIDCVRFTGLESDTAITAIPSPLRNVDPQILEALKGKDRLYVLKLGEFMESFINDGRSVTEYPIESPKATSYQRLLIHRCAAYYNLASDTDATGKISIASTVEGKFPALRISELVPETPAPPAVKKIMRRTPANRNKYPHTTGSVTGEDGDLSDLEPSETGSLGGRSNTTGGSNKKLMTIEEREAAYNEARSRIFMGFEEKEKVKDKDVNSSSSSLSVASGSTNNGGSSAGDAESSSGSPATESEWSGPVHRERLQNSGYVSASSSTRSIRSSAFISNGSGSSRNSRAASPSPFQFPSLYEPTTPSMPLYDQTQHTAPVAPIYHAPYGYSYNQVQPNPALMPYPYYPPPYPPYPPSHSHPPQSASDPVTPSSGESYGPPPAIHYIWQHPGQPPIHPPPMQPQHVQSQLPPSNLPHAMSPRPPGQPPYQPYMPPLHLTHQYPMPGYYPNQPVHPMPPPPPPPPAHPPQIPMPQQLFDPRSTNNGQMNGFRNNNPLQNNNRLPQRNESHGPMNGAGSKSRSVGGTAQPARAPWSYGPGIGSGGAIANSPQTNEAVGPRLSNARRQSNLSNSSTNGRSTSGDDVSSVTSSTSSSSRKATTVNAGSQHPLPPRPDWAINLKPHNNPRNMSPILPPRSISGGSIQSNYPSRHPSHPNPPIPLQLTDFPPLTPTSLQQPLERRPTGAWGNTGSRPNFSQTNVMNTEINNRFDDTGFERPPPKSSELYNPRTPKRAPSNPEKIHNGTDELTSPPSREGKKMSSPATPAATIVEQIAALSLGSSAPAFDYSVSTSTLASVVSPPQSAPSQ